jgi:hypothetical protein
MPYPWSPTESDACSRCGSRPFHRPLWFLAGLLCLAVLAPRALGKADPYAAYVAFLTKTLRVAPAVTKCAVAIDKKVVASPVFDLIFHLDRHLLRAKVERLRGQAIFSVDQPKTVDKTVVLQGTARLRGMQSWMKVRTRCGLHGGRVVATAIESNLPLRPLAKQIGD